ncbi:MAG: ABC transporter ATP-binding protein [Oscillospiraceae bacterium]|nr:ABC transporter ATP-binding protein [Oscillospiraceae bacterium]
MEAIKAIGLTKSYGKSRGIIDVDLSVEKGDFFGFIGPNGAGKSTTIRTLLGLISPTSGTAEIFGRDITGHRTEILSGVGYLPSEAAFYNGMRVGDILKLSADLHKKDCSDEAKKLCDRLQLDTKRKIEQLSLGNRKKVGIVCAMQHKPDLYIMDEPTSGLDPLIQREFYNLLKERSNEGATVFLSSHVLSEVQRYCRHAAVIREGRLLVCDSVEKLGSAEAKRVVLRGVNEIRLPGIKNLQQLDNGISFLYSGKADVLLKTLASMPVTDVTISEPDLEEIFMHFYEKEDN